MKQIAFTLLLLALQLLPLAAQEKSDTAFVFRFAPGKDVFYVPFKENETELQRLCEVLEANKELLQAGKMYMSSYAASGSTDYREMEQTQEKAITQEQALAEQTVRETAQRAATVQPVEEARIAEQKAPVEKANATPYTLALRANLLRWATLTPDLGMEWRINRHVGIVMDGTWTSWSWDNSNRRYALWRINPAIHYYIGEQKRSYIGAMYHIGEFNYKLSDTGKQGNLQGGGIVGGYQLPIGKCLMLDFNLGIGCTHASYDTYTLTDGVKVRTGNHTKNYWGINKAGVTLVWKLF